MKRYEVTERAAEVLRALSDENYLHFRKSQLCDVMCNVIDSAEENRSISEDLPLLSILSEVADTITELSKSREATDKQKS